MNNFLKSALFFVIGVTTFGSCKKSHADITPPTPPQEDIYLSATLQSTRVSIDPILGSGAKVVWNVQDQIALYSISTGKYVALFERIEKDETNKGTFKKIAGDFDPAKIADYKVVYPYNGEQTLEERYKGLETQEQDGNGTTAHLKVWMNGDIQKNDNNYNIRLSYELAAVSIVLLQGAGFDNKNETIEKFSFSMDRECIMFR